VQKSRDYIPALNQPSSIATSWQRRNLTRFWHVSGVDRDRPYKDALTLSRALDIVGKFRHNGHIDPTDHPPHKLHTLNFQPGIKPSSRSTDPARVRIPEHCWSPESALGYGRERQYASR
jgi:hypothetical protein